MTQTRDQVLNGEVEIDGATFVNCEFKNARLIYRGGTPPNFNNCRFTQSNFAFFDSAANTLDFLRAMAPKETNMRGVVAGLMPELGI